MEPALRQISQILKKYTNILLVIHQFPDGDTIASSLALYIALKNLGKKAIIVCQDDIPGPFQFLPEVGSIRKDFLQGDWDAMVVLDCGDLKRTGFSQRLRDFSQRKRRLINIDHHPKNDLHKIANINFFDFKAAAVAELVFKIIQELEVEIKKEIATCLLTALYTDTGGFMHSNTSAFTLELAAYLLRKGARLKMITRHIAGSRSLPALRLWGKALARITYNEKYNLVYSVITQKDVRGCGARQEDVQGVVNLINSIPQAKAVILMCEHPDNLIRVSLRTERKEVNVSRLAQIFDGGGHKKAAGFSVKGRLIENQRGWKVT